MKFDIERNYLQRSYLRETIIDAVRDRDPIAGIKAFNAYDTFIEDEVLSVAEQLRAERDAWRLLHHAKGNLTLYGYATLQQLQEILKAKKIVGIE